MSETYPLIRLTAALALMTLGGSAMYASVMVLEPAVQEFKTGRGVGSLLFGVFMFGMAFGGILMGRVGVATPFCLARLALLFVFAYFYALLDMHLVQ